MKVFLIDDERLALVQLERMLRQTTEVTSMVSFQDPMQAVEQAAALQPDIIFLDIHMPEITGLQAAELLSEVCPLADVVFVTAHDEYAVQAFELNAVDYVLKPVQTSRLQKTMERLITRRSLPAASETATEHTQKINCFKTLKFQSSGQSPELPKWRTAKAQELFAYMLHHRGQILHKSTLLEIFYPEMDLKRAMTQLYTTIYQVRQCIQKMNMNITIQNSSIQEGYILDIGHVVLDIEQWEKELDKLNGPISTQFDRVLHLLAEYEGDYLQDYGYIWAENERERLRQLWLNLARRLASYYLEEASSPIDALQIYERMQSIDPYNESDALIVMRLYDELGYYDKVTAHYERLSQSIEKELGLAVPRQVNTWYVQWNEKIMSEERLQ